MKTVILQLPGLNRDRDMIAAISKISGHAPQLVWQTERQIDDDVEMIIIPGGFSYGDYLRCGAIAARMPVMQAVIDHAKKGTRILGVCNGFQILVEAGLLPGALMRNSSLKFVCKTIKLEVATTQSAFTNAYTKGQIIDCPVAHHDGNYFAEPDTLEKLQDDDRIAFRYAAGTNPNGSIDDIAGILSEKRNVLGMMPHPENLIEDAHIVANGTSYDGRPLFEAALNLVNA